MSKNDKKTIKTQAYFATPVLTSSRSHNKKLFTVGVQRKMHHRLLYDSESSLSNDDTPETNDNDDDTDVLSRIAIPVD